LILFGDNSKEKDLRGLIHVRTAQVWSPRGGRRVKMALRLAIPAVVLFLVTSAPIANPALVLSAWSRPSRSLPQALILFGNNSKENSPRGC